MEEWFREQPGAVLSTTFDKYCYVEVRHLPRFFDYASELIYSKVERVKNREEILHPAIRNAMLQTDTDHIRLSYDADLPARTGLGTSSSFAVGMLSAFHALKGEYAGRRQLADEAIHLERVLCAEAGGWQDQIAVAYGGLNRISFGPEGYEVAPVVMSARRKKALNDNLQMYFTGFARFSSEIQKANNAEKRQDKKRILQEMYMLVNEAEKILAYEKADLNEIGRLLDLTWRLKRRTGSAITTSGIDTIYERGIAAGADGGKLLGAGGGGFLVFYVRPEYHEAVRRAMSDYMYIPFSFEKAGTQIIHYDPED